MTKVPWKGREISLEVFVATKAGQCVSVDQMILTQVGFIAQLKGTLSEKRYTAATIFVDHYSTEVCPPDDQAHLRRDN